MGPAPEVLAALLFGPARQSSDGGEWLSHAKTLQGTHTGLIATPPGRTIGAWFWAYRSAAS